MEQSKIIDTLEMYHILLLELTTTMKDRKLFSRKRKTMCTTLHVYFSNKLSILGDYNFIGLKNQLKTSSTQMGTADEILIDGGHMMNVLQAYMIRLQRIYNF